MVRKLGMILLVMCCLALTISVMAQDDMSAPLATGLNGPRHVAFGPDGTLYIAEAGTGGDNQVPGMVGGTVQVGSTAQVSAVSADGEQSVLLPEMTSAFADFATEGVSSVLVDDEYAWVVMAGLGPAPADVPEGLPPTASVLQISLASMEIENVIDVYGFEQANNPDGTEDLASNPQDIAVGPDGTLYIVDASANSLLSWTEADGLQLVAAWAVDETGENPAPVPTSVAVDADGAIYVGFLTGFPFPTGGARIEKWVDGALAETYEGLTMVTDVAIGQDGNLYAVQFASGLGEQGFNPLSGSVVMVSDEGITPVVEGLNFPYGIAQDADGNWVVSVNSAFAEAGSGMVLYVVEGMTMPGAEPAATPES
ncbi:MAG: ScyD/ScyE family protein [Anaerolineae bacterium]